MNTTTDNSTNRQWSEGTSPLCGVIDTGDRKMKDEHTAKVLRQIADEIERVGVERAHEGFECSVSHTHWTVPGDTVQLFEWIVDSNITTRPRPRTIQIGEHIVPEPLRVAPKDGERYFFPALHRSGMNDWHMWDGDAIDFRLLHRRLVHLDPESAAQHARALIAVSGGEVGE